LKFIITNDDGYSEPGLAALLKAVRPFGTTAIVAPEKEQSIVGHKVTMKAPIRVKQMDRNKWRVNGTPADCTRLALKQFVPDADWLIAGINPGANLGTDVYQSGTVAAAREAAILGVKAIAVSQYIAPDWIIDWRAAAHHASIILPMILKEELSFGQFWNINLPGPITISSTLEHVRCPLDKHPHIYRYSENGDAYQYEGTIHNRPRSMGSDVDVCFTGKIAITRMEV